MNSEQKRAWFVLVMVAVACIGFVALGLVFGFRGAWGAFGIFGLAGFAPLIGRGEKADERDISISRRATLAGGMASYGAFIFGCMGVWFVEFAWHRHDTVSVHLLGTITALGAIVFYAARSLAVLILYGRDVESDNA